MRLAMRIALITAGLAAAGAVAGGVVGAAMMFCWLLVVAGGLSQALNDMGMLVYGVLFGGFVGGVLGPAAAWLLMRDVPIWKAVSVTSLGTLAGAIAGLVAGGPEISFNLAFVGFGLSAIFLRVAASRQKRLRQETPAIALPR